MVVPMPTAGPHTAATRGFGNEASACKKRNTGDSWVDGGLFRKSAMSLPALNTVGSPWNTTTRVAASSRAASRVSARAAYMAAVNEFFLPTRLRVMVVTPASA